MKCSTRLFRINIRIDNKLYKDIYSWRWKQKGTMQIYRHKIQIYSKWIIKKMKLN